MKSSITGEFREKYARLPKHIQEQARKAYQRFQVSPDHPGLHFKKIHTSREIYSIRISRNYSALGVLEDGEITWFWIGSHSDYEQILQNR
jgi:hypothetical protein